MNIRSLIRVLAAASLLTLGGCASLSKSECLNANWEDIGVRDGANGEPEEYLIRHSTACAKVHVAPDRGAWLHGREQGLERYCQPHRMYSIGEYGGGFDAGICRNFDQERLVDAYEKGREVNRRSGILSDIDAELRDIRTKLENKELEKKERERLAYRLGQLEYQRIDAERDLDQARRRARDL
ncbi:MAG TPA: DUF2799 domain-containing protein [Steroidobacteraceae bacterium]|nr:DUF2799 domain-containing protein [Steroidobacteraceae bacterium]